MSDFRRDLKIMLAYMKYGPPITLTYELPTTARDKLIIGQYDTMQEAEEARNTDMVLNCGRMERVSFYTFHIRKVV